MTPLLPFAAGLIVGAAAVTVIRSDATRKGLSRAGTVLRETGESGLAAVSRSAEVLKRPFASGGAADDDRSAPAAAPDEQAESAPPATPARTPARSASSTAKAPSAAAKGGRRTGTRRKPAASDTVSDAASDDTPGDSA